MTTWYAISGPPGLSKEIVAKLNAAVVSSLDDSRVKQQLQLEGAEPRPMTSAEVGQFIQAQYNQWQPVAEKLRGK